MFKKYIAVAGIVLAVLISVSPAGEHGKNKPGHRKSRTDAEHNRTINAASFNSKITYPSIILGRPTDNSVTVNVLNNKAVEAQLEYGAISGKYPSKTEVKNLPAGKPVEFIIDNLKKDTLYYYRLCYHKSDETKINNSTEYTFHTQRAVGSTFCFAVQADSHLDQQSDTEIYKRALLGELADKPDFIIDLGDTFMSDKLNEPSRANIIKRHLLQRGYFSLICHSVPLYLALGNHEGEQGWRLNGTKDNLAVLAVQTRKTYFPNPVPDGFYTGNTKVENFVGLRENYYAWIWGDGLFVVLDPYWYTVSKPGKNSDNWNWTLGQVQYNWLKNVLEKSNAKFKFVFCHQLIGGKDSQSRGGAEFAKFYEMGGLNEDGSWGFDKKRPGWEKPVHKLMADNNVTVFFHGHDHFFAEQKLDGVIYQLVPQPSHPNFEKAGQAADYGYTTGNILPSSGYLRITVSPQNVKVDYIRAHLAADETGEHKNGQVVYSYTITR
jgi:hypothetical protein